MSEVQAVAPAFGVVVQVTDDLVLLKAVDSPGRSKPHFAALIAVKNGDSDGGRLCFASGATGGDDDLVVLNIPEDHQDSPFTFKVRRAKWPKSPLVLMLLFYLESRGVGGDDEPRQTMVRMSANADPRSMTLEAVRQALKSDTKDKLRTGLISGLLKTGAEAIASGEPGRPRGVTFAHASCHFPSDFLDRMPDDEHARPGPADASLLRLAEALDGADPPTLLLLAGDQVYVDSTAGLFDPKTTDDRFRGSYERRGQSRGVSAVMQRLDLQVEAMLDDHEIVDNWDPGDPGQEDPITKIRDRKELEHGKTAYFRYQRAKPFRSSHDHVWRFFQHRGLPFFLGDSRSERVVRTALAWRCAKIMTDEQSAALNAWLLDETNAGLPKFFLTPSTFLPRQLNVARDPLAAIHSDAWDGFPHSQHGLMKFLFEHRVRGVVMLSGDQHISSFTTATITKRGSDDRCVFHSIHSSGLYAPYPFANATPNDFPHHDVFHFPDFQEGPYCCEARTEFADKRDGFAVVTASPADVDWTLRVKFWSRDGEKESPSPEVTLGMDKSPG